MCCESSPLLTYKRYNRNPARKERLHPGVAACARSTKSVKSCQAGTCRDFELRQSPTCCAVRAVPEYGTESLPGDLAWLGYRGFGPKLESFMPPQALLDSPTRSVANGPTSKANSQHEIRISGLQILLYRLVDKQEAVPLTRSGAATAGGI